MAIDWSPVPINLAELMRTMMEVHGHEVLIDGAFNADPHPGNILLLTDGRLGLIDYGQLKFLNPEIRGHLARLTLALEADDRAEIVRIQTEDIGVLTENGDADNIYRATTFWNERDWGGIMQFDDIPNGQDLSMPDFFKELQRRDPLIQVNDDQIMVSRCSAMLRHLAKQLGMQVRQSTYWGPIARQYLESRGEPLRSPRAAPQER